MNYLMVNYNVYYVQLFVTRHTESEWDNGYYQVLIRRPNLRGKFVGPYPLTPVYLVKPQLYLPIKIPSKRFPHLGQQKLVTAHGISMKSYTTVPSQGLPVQATNPA